MSWGADGGGRVERRRSSRKMMGLLRRWSRVETQSSIDAMVRFNESREEDKQ